MSDEDQDWELRQEAADERRPRRMDRHIVTVRAARERGLVR
jgi:hypothetical protein